MYELIDAINRENDEDIIEELGDVLLQVMLHSQIGEDNGYFTVDDVIKRLSEKMIHRHPHVFHPDEESKSWEELKQEEKKSTVEESSWTLLLLMRLHSKLLISFRKKQQKLALIGPPLNMFGTN